MYSDVPEEINPDISAAVSATILGAAETASSELDKGSTEKVIVDSERGKIIVTGAGKALLVCLTRKEVGLGLVLVEMDRAMEKIKEVI
jgi:hypothetical protein